MLEKTLELRLRRAVETAGGLCLKWVCPGRRGVPDRMILFPGGVVAFVELKRPGEKIRAQSLQAYWQRRLRALGFVAAELADPAQIEPFVRACAGRSAAAPEEGHAV